ncbi:MAG: hypothetical protein IPG60_16510 [Bacteroidetes bacterium]|nr:hypothetical protein [Bacteroidota bacterium]
MPIDEYYALISNVPVAIFGHRRQEAAGNIFYLIGKGVKIFLRNDNNMISWFRDRGFIVYSFEDNLSSINDLRPLTYDERK